MGYDKTFENTTAHTDFVEGKKNRGKGIEKVEGWDTLTEERKTEIKSFLLSYGVRLKGSYLSRIKKLEELTMMYISGELKPKPQ